MPLAKEFLPVYDVIKSVCRDYKLSASRADDYVKSDHIMEEIWALIYNALYIICDCTDQNANVMYELGIAHTLGKEVTIITQDARFIPFDLKHIRYILYDTRTGKDDLRTKLETLISGISGRGNDGSVQDAAPPIRGRFSLAKLTVG